MSTDLPDWPRPFYQRPGGRPLLFYMVYGSFSTLPGLSAARYRSRRLPPGVVLSSYDDQSHPEVLSRFREGYVWNEFVRQQPDLAKQVLASNQCIMLRGELEDQNDLNYLRDTVGLLTFLVDHGGIVIYDPQKFQWWQPDQWKDQVFNPGIPEPSRHVVILTSEEENQAEGSPLTWFHTRGMRKFGRPDLSVRGVPPHFHEGVIDLCQRLIEWQALGAIIEEGYEVRMKSLPAGLTCRHAGDLDDLDFNNVHVEISRQRGFPREP